MVNNSPLNNIDNILKYITSYDKSGANTNKIDTHLEFGLLGEYLNGKMYLKLDNKANSSFELAPNDLNFLKRLYDSLKSHFIKKDSENNNLPLITFDNIEQYEELFSSLYYKSSDSEENLILKTQLEKVMYDFLKNNGADVSDTTPDKLDFSFAVREFLIKHRKKTQIKSNTQETLKFLNTTYNKNELKKAIKNHIKENNIKTIEHSAENIDIGNGQFDKVATQKTELCWAHAGLKTLLLTEKGKELIENNRYYDKKTGVFAIHLQEAENNGFHKGIYIITPEDIANEGGNLSTGEGDVTAYMIAIKKYFEEVRKNPELYEKMEKDKKSVRDVDLGNYPFRFFEILTGTTASQYNYDFKDFQDGIGNSLAEDLEFEKIEQILNKKAGAIIISFNGHAMSVIGIKDNKLLVQESNNSKEFMSGYKNPQGEMFTLVQDGESPIYELSRENYEYYINTVSYLKWESLITD